MYYLINNKLNFNINLCNCTENIDNFNKLNDIIFNLLNIFNNNTQNIIGVYLKKNCNTVLIIYAILLTGNIYLPLDIMYPKEKIYYYIKNSNCKYIITDDDIIFDIDLNNMVNINYKLLIHNTYNNNININNYLNNFNNFLNINNHIAYILYTSGSTGNPKGTINKLSSLINHILFLKNTFNFNNEDILLLKTPFSFDASTWEIYLPLFCNIKLFIANDNVYKDPKKLAENIIENNINIIQIVPSLSSYLIEYIKLIDPKYKLKYIFCGGEILTKKTAKDLLEITDKVINLYGPSECCCNTVYYEINNYNIYDIKTTHCPIGKPILNTIIKVINKLGEEIFEKNIDGELYIGGDSVGLGYINNMLETNKKFIYINSIPFYKTGDIVKYTYNNNLIFSKRVDSEIKLNGQKINFEEIEEIIYKHPYINNCKILLINNIITCHIIPKNIDINILNNICSNYLEKYKIPKKIITYEYFPTLDNGKIDINMIINNFNNNYIINNTTKYTLLEYEKNIIKIISNLLEINNEDLDLNINLNFLGLDSIKIVILKHKIMDYLKIDIDMNEIKSIIDLINKVKILNISKNNSINMLNNDKENDKENENFIYLIKNIIDNSNKIVVFHSSFKNFDLKILTLKIKFQNLILEYIDKGYTFLFPYFNSSFCENKYYHYKYTKSQICILSEWIFELNNSCKTKNPIYTWIVIGEKKNEIIILDNNNCFGKNTVFDYLYNNESSYILIDCKNFTQFHYCEEISNVDWRFYKIFQGIVNYDGNDKYDEIKMFCRKLNMNNDFEFTYFDSIINIIEKYFFNKLIIYNFSTKKICDVLIRKLINNELVPIK